MSLPLTINSEHVQLAQAPDLYLLSDPFDGSGAPSGKWVESDAGGYGALNGAGAYYAANGGPAWNNPSLGSVQAFARSELGAFAALVRITGGSGAGGYGPGVFVNSSRNASDPTANGRGIRFSFPNLRVTAHANNLNKPGTRTRSIDYAFIVIPRPGGGASYWVSGGIYGAWPTATLLWVDDAGSEDPLYGNIGNFDGDAYFLHARALKASALSAALGSRYGFAAAADTFSRANGALGGSSTEVGGLTWTTSGTVNIASNAVAPAANGEAIVNAGIVPRIIEVTVTTPASGTVAFTIPFRRANAGQLVEFVVRPTLISFWENGAGPTYQTAFSIGNGVTKRIRILDWGSHYDAYCDDASLTSNSPRASTTNNTNTQVGFRRDSTDNGTTFKNFAIYGPTATLPEKIIPFPAPPVGTGSAIASDTFTAADGTALTTHNPAFTTTGAGVWEINGNKARMDAAARNGAATVDIGVTDHEISVDITLPGSNPVTNEWLPGVYLRFTDSNNFLFARYLYQGNSPEVELVEKIGGVFTGGSVAQFVNFGGGSLVAGNTYNLKAAVKGSEVAVYHQGEVVLQYTTTLLTGTRVGFGTPLAGTVEGQPTYDNLTIKPAA